VSLWGTLSIPPDSEPVFPGGIPRHGDGYNIDVGNYGHHPAKLADVSFAYGAGPTQRFVVDMDPVNGPTARNALPGGEIWDNTSTHFRDEAEYWRRNKNHPVAFTHADVAAAAEERIVYGP
jgi:penicillin amidase